jgi:hypothetical protein
VAAVNEAGVGTWHGPIEVYVPLDDGGGDGGDGDGDGDGGLPLADLAIGGVLMAAAAGAGLFLGRRFGRKGL